LYIAPTPGISPRTAAAAGFGSPAEDATKGLGMFCHAIQHGSHRICPPAPLRTQLPHNGLPQFWQNAVAVTPL
jgi:hypothetical protein